MNLDEEEFDDMDDGKYSISNRFSSKLMNYIYSMYYIYQYKSLNRKVNKK